MNESDAGEKAMRLADEMKALLEENILKDPKSVSKAMKRVDEIKKEIEAMGFPVEWNIDLDFKNLEKTSVTVTLYRPRENLSPELQKMYDQWLIEATIRKNKKENPQ